MFQDDFVDFVFTRGGMFTSVDGVRRHLLEVFHQCEMNKVGEMFQVLLYLPLDVLKGIVMENGASGNFVSNLKG